MLVCVATLPMANAQTFARVGALPLNPGENYLRSAVIDVDGGFAYFGTDAIPGIVVKVKLSDMTRVGALTLNAGENQLWSAVVDAAGGFAYFGTSTSPGIVVKVKLSDMTHAGALTLNLGENTLGSAVIDAAGGFAYFGTLTSPGIVVKIEVGVPTPPAAPVGGVLSPVDKLAIVAPYLSLLGLVGAVLAVAVVKRKPRN